MKKVLIIVSVIVVAAYLAFAMMRLNVHPEQVRCKKIEVIIKDTSDVDMLTKSGVVEALRARGIHLIGKKMVDIDTRMLEKVALHFPLGT
jgi:hypothetical protein